MNTPVIPFNDQYNIVRLREDGREEIVTHSDGTELVVELPPLTFRDNNYYLAWKEVPVTNPIIGK